MDFIKTRRADLKLFGNALEFTRHVCTVSILGIEESPYYTTLIVLEIKKDFPEIDPITIKMLPGRDMTSVQFSVPGDVPLSYVSIFDTKKLNSRT
jgi:hypothetical protein